MGKIQTRMGDGFRVEMTEAEIRHDLEEGVKDAVLRAEIPPLTEDELQYLFEIIECPDQNVSVKKGNEVILSYDSGTTKFKRANVSVSKIQSLQIYERLLGADTMDLGHIHYSFKPVKPIVPFEVPILEHALLMTIAPVFYGACPDLGSYAAPDGPCPNPADLLPKGKISEARASYDDAMAHLIKDAVYVSSAMYEAGADAINFDTTAAAGDAEFLAALKAVEILKKKYPQMCIMMGMASEFVLGMHGDVSYDGVRLAGLYPDKQVKMAEKAGVTIFGPSITIVSTKSLPWNIARSVTFVKACCEASNIPVHLNAGMGVGGVPLALTPPGDAVSRTSKAHVEICKLDGL